MTSDGAVQIAVARNVHIQSITITSSPLRFSKLADTYDLTNLGYTEPTLIGASGATVTYTGNKLLQLQLTLMVWIILQATR